MSDNNSLFAEGTLRGIAKLARIVGVVMVVLAVGLYVRFVAASNSSAYDKIPAVITAVTIPGADTTIRKATYEYQVGQQVMSETMIYPSIESKKYAVGNKFMLLHDIETGEIIFADGGDAIGAVSLKLGFYGLLILIASVVFLRSTPASKS